MLSPKKLKTQILETHEHMLSPIYRTANGKKHSLTHSKKIIKDVSYKSCEIPFTFMPGATLNLNPSKMPLNDLFEDAFDIDISLLEEFEECMDILKATSRSEMAPETCKDLSKKGNQKGTVESDSKPLSNFPLTKVSKNSLNMFTQW
jgi:hypothetical protein